jgi:septal ring factor EnvC (AmiA/AmiB activator)
MSRKVKQHYPITPTIQPLHTTADAPLVKKIKDRIAELDGELGRRLAFKSQLTAGIEQANKQLAETNAAIQSLQAAIGEFRAMIADPPIQQPEPLPALPQPSAAPPAQNGDAPQEAA